MLSIELPLEVMDKLSRLAAVNGESVTQFLTDIISAWPETKTEYIDFDPRINYEPSNYSRRMCIHHINGNHDERRENRPY
jgi:hypothetical protein